MLIRDKPLFIAGHPKSGTSLLLSILDSHPELIVYPEETYFFRRYLPLAVGKSIEKKILLSQEHLTQIFEWDPQNPASHQQGYEDRDYTHIPAAEIQRGVKMYVRERFEHDGDMLSAAVMSFGGLTGQISPQTKYWVEKTPYNEYFAEDIFRWWPDARMIHIVRDPRDNYASYRRKKPDWSAEFFALNWLHSTKTGLSNRRTYGKNRYLILEFGDLTTSIEPKLEEICDFLGIKNVPSLRQPRRFGRVWGGNSMFEEQFTEISSAPVGRWKHHLSDGDTIIIEALTASLMRAFNINFSDHAREMNSNLHRKSIARLLAYTIRRPRMPENERAAIDSALDYLVNPRAKSNDKEPDQDVPNIMRLVSKLIFSVNKEPV